MTQDDTRNFGDLEQEPLRLDQFMKIAGAVDSGGQAKQMIQAGEILVNGEVETRRRRKLFPGDVVSVGEYDYLVPADLE
jgi:ribosome-associated protein